MVLLFAVDTVRPEIQFCPQNINQQIQFGVPSVIVTWNQPIASDNSGQTPNVQTTHQSGSSFRVGTTTVIYTFTDDAGNEAICSFNVNIVSGKKTYTVDFTNCVSMQKVSHFESDFLSLLAFPARVLVFCFVCSVLCSTPTGDVSYKILISARGQARLLSNLLVFLHIFSCSLSITIVLLFLVNL